jgi:dethiobiotin synthetase
LFEMPAAPMVAAEAAGVHIDPLALVAGFQRVADRHEFVVVEGAGGLLVPIADGCTFLDLARMLSLPVLCVVGSRLGCINHALLTLRALQTSGVPCAGYVLNEICRPGDGSPTTDSNRAAIRRFTGQKDLGVLPYVSESVRENWDELGALAQRNLDLDRLLARCA